MYNEKKKIILYGNMVLKKNLFFFYLKKNAIKAFYKYNFFKNILNNIIK